MHPATCHDGSGKYQEKFSTGVTVGVGAKKNGQLSSRACEARLTWNKQELLAVPDAWEVDVDLLGADVGLGTPVAAFKIKKSDIDVQSVYQIYSLKKPPQLLRTIVGGASYRAADTDMDGLVEIWTDDARAVDGFERLPLDSLDFAPTVVLRFEDHQLLDVSSQFPSHYDSQIAEVRSHLDAQELSDFRNSTGTLSMNIVLPGDQLHRLMRTKIKVLEIVWSYLYSGREQQAWHELAEMWPTADYDRIRAAMLDARTRGILKETDVVSLRPSRWFLKKRSPAYIFDEANENPQEPVDPGSGRFATVQSLGHHAANPTADTRPKSILLRRQPPSSNQDALPKTDELVDLVIDVAGKVHSAKSAGSTSKDLITDAAGWNFIPAFKSGHPVASHLRLQVGYMQ
ncbi:MAG: hypothetical protein P4K86_06015 [Terracidiphilus sp.]|nr:hypothetical protein [Terracidiphilus sp.]MDR3776650.1 hypothetical protein [Terracidiphilus sp.]